MSTVNPYFITPLYRDIVKPVQPGEIVPLPKSNYNRYNLFVLRTRLQVLVRRRWNKTEIHFIFESIQYELDSKPRLYIQARPIVGNKDLKLDLAHLKQYQTMIEKATSTPLDYAVLFSDKNYLNKDITIPGFWIMNILPQLIFPSRSKRVKHRYGVYGLEVNVYGFENAGYPNYPADDYDNLKNVDSYIEKYTELQVALEDQFIPAFKRGVKINPPLDIIQKWNLKPIKDNLYHPNWIDQRITRPFSGVWHFLNSRIMGNRNLKIPVGNNLVIIHRIAKLFYNSNTIPTFYRIYLNIEVDDYKDANDMMELVYSVSKSAGKIAVFRVIEAKYIPSYIRIAKKIGLKDVLFYYKDGIYGKELNFSCELSNIDMDIQIVIHNIQRRVLKYVS